MKPTKTYYRGEQVKYMFTLPDPTKVDIGIGDKAVLHNVEKSELLIPLVDAEAQIATLEKQIEDIKQILGCTE